MSSAEEILGTLVSRLDANAEEPIKGLPLTSGKNAIAVGFEDETALKHLDIILRKYLLPINNNSVESQKKEEASNQVHLKKVEDIISKVEGANKQIKETNDSINKSFEETSKYHAEIKKEFSKLSSYAKQAINIVVTAFEKMVASQDSWKKVARELESAGIVNNGYKDFLDNGANKAGMAIEDFTKAVISSSKNINKLTKNFGEGHKKFAELISSIDDSLGYTQDEKAKIIDYFLSTYTQSEVMKMKTEELGIRANEAAKNLKNMSLQLGISTDELIRNNKEQQNTKRWSAFLKRHAGSEAILKSMNLSEDEKDYIASGKMTSELAIKMASIPGYKAAIDEISIAARTNRLNSEVAQKISKKYYNYALAREEQVKFNAENRGGMVGASYYQNIENQLYDTGGGIFDYIRGTGAKNFTQKELDNRGGKNTNQLVNENYKILSKLNNLEDYLKSGGEEGINKTLEYLNKGNGYLLEIRNYQEKLMEKLGGEGFWAGIFNNLFDMGAEAGGDYLLGKASKFAEKGSEAALEMYHKKQNENYENVKKIKSGVEIISGLALAWYGASNKGMETWFASGIGNYLIGQGVSEFFGIEGRYLKPLVSAGIGLASASVLDSLITNPAEIKNIEQPKFDNTSTTNITNNNVQNNINKNEMDKNTKQYQDESLLELKGMRSILEKMNLDEKFKNSSVSGYMDN